MLLSHEILLMQLVQPPSCNFQAVEMQRSDLLSCQDLILRQTQQHLHIFFLQSKPAHSSPPLSATTFFLFLQKRMR